MTELGLTAVPTGWLLEFDAPVTQDQKAQARKLAVDAGLYVETRPTCGGPRHPAPRRDGRGHRARARRARHDGGPHPQRDGPRPQHPRGYRRKQWHQAHDHGGDRGVTRAHRRGRGHGRRVSRARRVASSGSVRAEPSARDHASRVGDRLARHRVGRLAGCSAAASPARSHVVASNSAPGWIRTSNLRIRRPLLYPLSYGGFAPG